MNSGNEEHDIQFIGYTSQRMSQLTNEEVERWGGRSALSEDEFKALLHPIYKQVSDELDEMHDIYWLLSPEQKTSVLDLISRILRIRQRTHDEIAQRGGRDQVTNKERRLILKTIVVLDAAETIPTENKDVS